MPDTAALQIINLNIDSIGGGGRGKTNIKQEMHTVHKMAVRRECVFFVMFQEIVVEKNQKIHDTFGDVFNGIGCFKGTFSLQLKPGSKPYQVPPRQVAYALQKPGTGAPAEDRHNYPTRGR